MFYLYRMILLHLKSCAAMLTSGLDVISADAVLTLVENFVKLSGSSCIFITHSKRDAMRIANRVVIMRDGRITEQGHLIN